MTRLTALLAIAATLPLAPAFAAPASVRVPFADLDLSTDGGRSMLDRRIHAATSRVCDTVDSRELAQRMACRDEAAASARTQLAQAIGGAATTALR